MYFDRVERLIFCKTSGFQVMKFPLEVQQGHVSVIFGKARIDIEARFINLFLPQLDLLAYGITTIVSLVDCCCQTSIAKS